MPARILLAKPGLDVHDRGMRVIAQACRDAGMEVIYVGIGLNTMQQIAAAASEEDVDVVGLSIMTGDAAVMCADVVAALRQRDAEEIPVIVGGVIRKDAVQRVLDAGARAVFRAGTSLDEVIAQINEVVGAR